MTDIVRFLNARLTEDAKRYQTIWLFRHAGRKRVDGWWDLGGSLGYAVHDLADTTRGGREVAAKRRLIEMHPQAETWIWDVPRNPGGPRKELAPWCSECQVEDGVVCGQWPCDTLRLLAFPYSSHPDYRDEWRLDA